MTPELFVDRLSKVRSPNTFNPYSDVCADHDHPNSPSIRRANLEAFLHASISASVDTIWVGRDLGHRGGRRTGIAFTDEVFMQMADKLIPGLRFNKATARETVAEATAKMVWGEILKIGQPVFLWNVFPLHPHEARKPLSNRCHTKDEHRIGLSFLEDLLTLLKPKLAIGIGNEAAKTLEGMGVPMKKVRHPSFGGKAKFIEGIRCAYANTYLKAPETQLLQL